MIRYFALVPLVMPIVLPMSASWGAERLSYSVASSSISSLARARTQTPANERCVSAISRA
jgi:hypothetical protein